MTQAALDAFVKDYWAEIVSALNHIPLYRNMVFSGEALDERCFHQLPFTQKQDITRGFPFNFVGGREADLGEKLESGVWEIIESSGTSADRIQIIRPANFRDHWSSKIRKYHRVYADRNEVREALLTTLNCSRAQCNLGVASYEERLFGERLALNRSKSPALWNDHECERMLAEIERFNPQVLTAHPVYLTHLDRWCEAKGVTPPKSDAVFLSYDYATERNIARAIRWSRRGVFRAYGLTEVFTIAMDCENGSLHAIGEGCLVEVIPFEESTRFGEIVVTSLRNEVMPLIRYRTGDLAQITELETACSCERSGPIIGRIEGRINELTYSTASEPVTVATLDDVVSGFHGVDLFQLEQSGDHSVVLGIITNDTFCAAQEQALREALMALYRTDRVTVNRLPEIVPTRTGKFKIVTKSTVRDVITAHRQ